ncbi:MAG: hypothetical protein ABR538_05310 [Candidatus Binatia bacterium]
MQHVASGRTIATIATLAAVLLLADVASAQLPVCPQPEPGRPVYSMCAPGGRFVVVPLLTNLAVDQLFRVGTGPIRREPQAVFTAAVSEETRERNSPLVDYLGRLGALELTPIDTAGGTLRMDVAEDDRSFTTGLETGGGQVRLELELPERIEGGYWRTPGVLQMAFWKGARAKFRTTASGTEVAAEIECVVVSTDGIRLVTTGVEAPDILVGYDPCP